MSSSRFHTINTTRIHTHHCILHHASTEITQHYNQIPEHSTFEIIVKPRYRLRVKNKDNYYTTNQEVNLLLLQPPQRSGELLNFLLVLHFTVGDVWFILRLGVMEFFWLQPHLAGYQGRVHVTICVVIQVCEKHIFEAGAPDDDHVQFVQLLRLRVSSGNVVLKLGIEEGIGYAEVMVRIELQELLSILIYIAYYKVTKAGRQCVMICPHSSIEVSQKNKLIPFGDTPRGYILVLMEFILDLRCGIKDEVIKLIRVIGPSEVLSQRASSYPEPLLHGSTILSSGCLIANPHHVFYLCLLWLLFAI